MENSKISVIVPVYNVERYIHRCIDSIINQTYKNLEIILINDGSTDKCPSICNEYEDKDSRVKVIHKENGGLSDARNIGIDIATGEYITFIDSDDFISENFIERLYQISISNNCDIVQCKFEIGANEFFSTKIIVPNIEILSSVDALCNRKLKVTACGKLYKTKVIKGIKFPVGIINEDDATYYRFIYNANKVGITSEELYYYYQSDNSITRNNDTYKKTDFIQIYEERIRFFKEKRESILLYKSYERYCLVLMLFYMGCKKNRQNKNNKKEILNLYKENFKFVINSKFTSVKFKLMFILFRIYPNVCSYVVNTLKLR